MSGIVEAYLAYSIMVGLVVWFSRELLGQISSLEAELEVLSSNDIGTSDSADSAE